MWQQRLTVGLRREDSTLGLQGMPHVAAELDLPHPPVALHVHSFFAVEDVAAVVDCDAVQTFASVVGRTVLVLAAYVQPWLREPSQILVFALRSEQVVEV